MSVRDEALAREWFEKAEHDLLNIDNNLVAVAVPTDTVCFHCHQVGEKYLKGFLTWHAAPFNKTHDLGALLMLCAAIEPHLGSLLPPANLLTDYAVDTRYPGMPFSDPTLAEARRAYDAAREIRHVVRLLLGMPTT